MANRRDLVNRFVARVQEIARQRDSGYAVGMDEMDAFEFTGLLFWDDEMDQYRRSISMAGLQMK